MKRFDSDRKKMSRKYFCKLLSCAVNFIVFEQCKFSKKNKKKTNKLFFLLSFFCKRMPSWLLIQVKLDIGSISSDHLLIAVGDHCFLWELTINFTGASSRGGGHCTGVTLIRDSTIAFTWFKAIIMYIFLFLFSILTFYFCIFYVYIYKLRVLSFLCYHINLRMVILL